MRENIINADLLSIINIDSFSEEMPSLKEYDIMINFEAPEKRSEFFEKLSRRQSEIYGLDIVEDEKVISDIQYRDVFEALSITEDIIAKSLEPDEDISLFDETKDTGSTRACNLKKVDSVAITLPFAIINALSDMAEELGIQEVEEDFLVFEDVFEGAKTTGVNPDLWDLNLKGNGIKVAVLDTGVDTNHPDLAYKNIITGDFTYTYKPDTGHGMHVASTILGDGSASDGKYQGIAPEAELYSGKVLPGKASGIILALEWASENQVDLINMSLGSRRPSDGKDNLSRAVNQIVDDGIVVLCAAGNTGSKGPQNIGSPAAAQNAITVAASTGDDRIAHFSSQGPIVGDEWIKPDISAPGQDIIAGLAGGISGKPDPKYEDKPSLLGELGYYYTYKSGTSMATPIMTGICALLLESYYKKHGDDFRNRKKEEKIPIKLKNALLETTKDLFDENGERYSIYKQGKGRIQAKEAHDKFLQLPLSTEIGEAELGAEISEVTNHEIMYMLDRLKNDTVGNRPCKDVVLVKQLKGTMILIIKQIVSSKQKSGHYANELKNLWDNYEQLISKLSSNS